MGNAMQIYRYTDEASRTQVTVPLPLLTPSPNRETNGGRGGRGGKGAFTRRLLRSSRGPVSGNLRCERQEGKEMEIDEP